ncbi:MAG: Multidrug resistance protein MdtC [Phycisphaerae bacterium]|nr:Multidrug resistance protein MdtC [Phycisphaerae bacterium]
MKISEKAIDRPRLVLVAAIAICLVGGLALARLPLERTPRVTLPLILVAAPNLGSSPEDNEVDIVEKLEKDAENLDHLKSYEAMAMSGAAVLQFEFTDKADIDRAKDDVQELINRHKPELPGTVAQDITVTDISFTDWPIIQIIVSGNKDPRELRQIAEDLRDELTAQPGVAAADLFGGREREVQVLVNPHLMVQRGVDYDQIAAAVQSANLNLPAGRTHGDAQAADVQYRGKFATPAEIEGVVVEARPGGNVLVRDVATVVDGFKDVRSLSWCNGGEAVVLNVRPKSDINTLEVIRDIHALIDRENVRLADRATLNVAGDTGREIRIMVRQLSSSALFGVALVLVALWIFMGLRNALVIAFAIPFSILFTFGIMLFIKLTINDEAAINNMVLFSLILIVGMVVDGALIVGENIFRHIESGMDRRSAAKVGIREVGTAVISADLTTIAAFAPMLLVSGVMGEFLKFMPIVVSMALTASMLVDHFLLPAVARFVMKRGVGRLTSAVGDAPPGGDEGQAESSSLDDVRRSADATRLSRPYRGLITWALHHRGVILILTGVAVTVAISAIGLGLIGFEFFPKSDLAQFRINYELPPGRTVGQTLEVGRKLLPVLDENQKRGELESPPVITVGDPGVLAAQFGAAKSGPQYGTISVELVMPGKRSRSMDEIIDDIRRRMPRLPELKDVRVDIAQEGPPAGSALVVRVSETGQGRVDDLGLMSERLERILRATPGSKDVTSDWLQQRKISVAPRRQLASMSGVSDGQIGSYESYALNGVKIAEANFGGDESIDIRLQNLPRFRSRQSLADLPILGRSAGSDGRVRAAVRDLGEVADIRDDVLAPYAINHRGGNRIVSLRTDTADGYIADHVQANFLHELDRAGLGPAALQQQGFNIEFGGENEERDRSVKELSTAWIFGVIAIGVILVIQFDSFRQPFIVMMAIPLSFIGVIIGLVITGYNFSIATMIGVVALAGIVVNDAIVLVTFINQLRAAGMSKYEAIVRAGQLRLRPIFLTTLTTIVGLLPLTLDFSGGGDFWRPLTTAIMFGLAFATLLTLVVLPVAYSLTVRESAEHRGEARELPPTPVPAGN